MNAEQIRGVVRSVILFAGGVAVSSGYLSAELWATIAGALATLGAVGWSIYSNGLQNTLTQAAADPAVSEIVVNQPGMAESIPSPKVVPLT